MKTRYDRSKLLKWQTSWKSQQVHLETIPKKTVAVKSMEIMTKICKLIQASYGSLKPLLKPWILNLVTLCRENSDRPSRRESWNTTLHGTKFAKNDILEYSFQTFPACKMSVLKIQGSLNFLRRQGLCIFLHVNGLIAALLWPYHTTSLVTNFQREENGSIRIDLRMNWFMLKFLSTILVGFKEVEWYGQYQLLKGQTWCLAALYLIVVQSGWLTTPALLLPSFTIGQWEFSFCSYRPMRAGLLDCLHLCVVGLFDHIVVVVALPQARQRRTQRLSGLRHQLSESRKYCQNKFRNFVEHCHGFELKMASMAVLLVKIVMVIFCFMTTWTEND